MACNSSKGAMTEAMLAFPKREGKGGRRARVMYEVGETVAPPSRGISFEIYKELYLNISH